MMGIDAYPEHLVRAFESLQHLAFRTEAESRRQSETLVRMYEKHAISAPGEFGKHRSKVTLTMIRCDDDESSTSHPMEYEIEEEHGAYAPARYVGEELRSKHPASLYRNGPCTVRALYDTYVWHKMLVESDRVREREKQRHPNSVRMLSALTTDVQ